MGIPILKIKRTRDRLIFNMGIPIPGKDGLYVVDGAQIVTFIMPTRSPEEHNPSL